MLNNIAKDSGESSFSSDAFEAELDGCILVYSDGEPIACGVFRHHANETCELKRMYSKLTGAGKFLLKQLEAYAVRKGYCKAVLSTRRVNYKAVGFYERNFYTESEPYGKYTGVERSICLSQTLIK